MSIVKETVVLDTTTQNTFTATESPAHDGINNGVDTPNDAQSLFAGTISKIFTGGFALPNGTGYDRISKVKLRIRVSAEDDVLRPGLLILLAIDGPPLGVWTLGTDTDGGYKVLFIEVEDLDISEATAEVHEFQLFLQSANGAAYDDPNWEQE